MRITGGIARGRRLTAPAGSKVRPTSDKVKQALFNILGSRVPGAAVLDLFAGAGSIGLEALSRDAALVVFVDASRDSLAAIRRNSEVLERADRARIVASTVENFLKKPSGAFDIVFLDPPYSTELAPLLAQVVRARLLTPDAVVIAEHFKKRRLPEQVEGLQRFREAVYGDTVLSFYRAGEREQEGS